MNDRLIDLHEYLEITGRSRSTEYRDRIHGRSPEPRKIGVGRNNRWLLSEVQAWIRGEWKPEGAQ
ncbi:helix-turn-helix transcriptional regulator [Sansalvadorimonas verongulae]|uniref:helix-turn-helix transcriptional regulator n=1 Tax=Sansalvadorimonas verongulae TaxID=2172824 RepID=UPI0012BD17F6|nr:AlpA family phage regulatory protein [Sansalvadorimonas verongulae]MTI13244.1 AlpA family phage regulatory protein [Sansalvadorimonas verongulae]